MKHLSRPARVVAVFLMALSLALFAACSGSGNKPESTVESLEWAAARGEADKVVDSFSLTSLPDAQLALAKGKLQMMGAEMKTKADAHGGLKSIDIVKSEIGGDGNTATVQYKRKYGDGKEESANAALVKEDGRWKVKLR